MIIPNNRKWNVLVPIVLVLIVILGAAIIFFDMWRQNNNHFSWIGHIGMFIMGGGAITFKVINGAIMKQQEKGYR